MPHGGPHPKLRRGNALRWASGVVVAAVATVGLGAHPVAAAPGACASEAHTEIAARVPLLDFAENIGYDADGNLWVSRVARSEVWRYDSAGNVTARVPVPAPGAIALGPDRLLYVTFGNLPASAIPGPPDSGVVRFDPSDPAPVPQQFVTDLTMANGADFDREGNLYVGDTGSGVVRIRPDGTTDVDWTRRATLLGANGITVDGDTLYVTTMASLDAQIVRMSIDDPARRSSVARLMPGPVSLPALPDDLVAAEDGNLYLATTLGKLVRIDPEAHTTCEILSGEPMTSVALRADGDLMVGTESGNILRVQTRAR
ncbi:SMP-30/gluconolactonase/LRE family protein [Rhodococcus sp. NPDC058521]|uniref:SMP-30/gluconolactonase/LRE family protein n=1 Tax=Rhodococcus sp. NPDC058521 TaxID=3346536 RepID=UPI003657EEE1